MRTTPTIATVAIVALVWAVVVKIMHQHRSDRVQKVGVTCALVGVTLFAVWLMTDTGGPNWLHVVSAPAALLFIAAGAVVAGYAGWFKGP